MASKQSSSSAASHEVFSKVDDLVSKPVLGSDGAAKWQDFRSSNRGVSSQQKSVAPTLLLKRADRAAGFSSMEQERQVEQEVRRQYGHGSVGEGYSVFTLKGNAEDAAERKRIKSIRNRIRPDKVPYFLPAATFEGWKFDYIFTTREGRGTGYYWDGMDSVKQLEKKGDASKTENAATRGNEKRNAVPNDTEERPKKKKKKKKSKSTDQGPVIIEDGTNPMEQVALAIQKRQAQLQQLPSFLLHETPTTKNPTTLQQGWEAATDPTSGKTYYYCRSTGERSWDPPLLDTSDTRTNNETNVAEKNEAKNDTNVISALPQGWKIAKDPNTKKEYYYHAATGKTTWKRPT